MKKLLVSVILAGSLFVIPLQLGSILNPVNPTYSSINPTQSTVFHPNIDPIQGG